MKVFYYCQTGKYAALLAAAFHLKKFYNELSYREFLYYVKNINIQLYEPFFLGEDISGNKIYVVGTDIEEKIVATIVKSFVSTFTEESENTLVIDSLSKPNIFLILILKLCSNTFLKLIFTKLIPYAVWINRKNICRNLVYAL